MDLFTIIFVAFALSMDAFAVSLCIGASPGIQKQKTALTAGVFFGLFQAVMPLVGWLTGFFLENYIKEFDHWVAFALLVIIGLRMLYEAFVNKSCKKEYNTGNFWIMFVLAFATSIDALVVGLSFAFIQIPILLAIAIIGFVTFWVSYTGVYLGQKFCYVLGNKSEIAGGIVLMGIGTKILIEHIFYL